MRSTEHSNGARSAEHTPDLHELMDSALENAQGWFEARRRHAILRGSERAGELAGKATVLAIIVIGAVIAVLMASIALALWLGTFIGYPLAFLAVGVLYAIVLFFFNRVWGRAVQDRVTLAIINGIHGA